jgi:hypothetical protein
MILASLLLPLHLAVAADIDLHLRPEHSSIEPAVGSTRPSERNHYCRPRHLSATAADLSAAHSLPVAPVDPDIYPISRQEAR